jgi:hypothetical protein
MDSPTKIDVEPVKDVSSSGSPAPSEQSTAVSNVGPVGCIRTWLADVVGGAVDAYSRELKESPIRTKAITSCAIAMLGELIGTQLKPRKADGTRGNALWRTLARQSAHIIMYLCLSSLQKL